MNKSGRFVVLFIIIFCIVSFAIVYFIVSGLFKDEPTSQEIDTVDKINVEEILVLEDPEEKYLKHHAIIEG